MNGRLELSAIATRISDQLSAAAVTGVTVGTAYERQYWKLSGAAFPGVWVGGQTLARVDDGGGFAGLIRQRVRVEFAVRVIVQRAAAGVIDPEDALNELCDAVSDALIGWTPAGADKPITWNRTQDESPQETVLSAVMQFGTETTYQKVPA